MAISPPYSRTTPADPVRGRDPLPDYLSPEDLVGEPKYEPHPGPEQPETETTFLLHGGKGLRN